MHLLHPSATIPDFQKKHRQGFDSIILLKTLKIEENWGQNIKRLDMWKYQKKSLWDVISLYQG